MEFMESMDLWNLRPGNGKLNKKIKNGSFQDRNYENPFVLFNWRLEVLRNTQEYSGVLKRYLGTFRNE